jgi:Zn-dependent protease
MLLSLLYTNPLFFLIAAVGLIVAITIHEFAHAYVADKLGDPTPSLDGRVTLDPRAHLDPMGTLLLLIAGFGWGKPVVFDPYNLKEPLRDTALIALAGPVSNLILAAILALVINFNLLPFLNGVWLAMLHINVMLAIFNLVPVHPLDGSKILLALLPPESSYEYEKFMARYGMFVLLLLIFPWNGSSPISQLVSPIIDIVIKLLLV